MKNLISKYGNATQAGNLSPNIAAEAAEAFRFHNPPEASRVSYQIPEMYLQDIVR